MRQSLARFSGLELSVHTGSLADFITTTSGFRFSVHTGARRIHGELLKLGFEVAQKLPQGTGNGVPQDAQNLRPVRFTSSHFVQRTASGSVARDDELVP